MTLLLVQMTIVLLVALVCGWMARKLGQSRVRRTTASRDLSVIEVA